MPEIEHAVAMMYLVGSSITATLRAFLRSFFECASILHRLQVEHAFLDQQLQSRYSSYIRNMK